MRKYLISLFIVCFSWSVFGQLRFDTLGWIPPVDIPIFLSGNFAELRTGHFHAGIDIKTQGKEGLRVYAVQDGYISRIKISPVGYGKAIYIDHPDGHTSVYGHLSEYNIQLQKYVRNIQYQKKSYDVDIFPESGELPVKQGDVMGLSGNSGSSGGPHVHFEIRDTRSSQTYNGLFLGYKIEDNIPPKMEYLYVYPKYGKSHVNQKTDEHFYSLKRVNGQYALRQGDTISAFGFIGFGLKVNDYLNGSANRCGVYELKAYVNDSLIIYEKFDGFSFSETRYINSHMDYKENTEKKRKLHKLYIEPNNQLSIYVEEKNRGIVNFNKLGEVNKITIIATDTKANTSKLNFYVKTTSLRKKQLASNAKKITIPWQYRYTIDTMGLSVQFDEKSFYDTLFMDFSVDTTPYPNTYAALYQLHNENTPVHNYFDISIAHDSVVDSLQSKLSLALWDKNKFTSLGGVSENGIISGKIRDLGLVTVVIDTLPPIIKPLGDLESIQDINLLRNFRFKIEDAFSGIASYSGTINGKWVLFEYDAKYNLITYEFDENMPAEGMIELQINVVDARGNASNYVKRFEKFSERDNDVGQ